MLITTFRVILAVIVFYFLLQLDYDGNTVPLPFNFAILDWAADTRKVLNNTQIPAGVSFYNIYGTSFETPFDVW